ncbi:hypothetical protein MJN76_30390, partial [Salmonella enterica subsp. enterica serovar Anatum]|nr:hypothetical protein [Salmonella enterica subsp. enterica serovar Anatum]
AWPENAAASNTAAKEKLRYIAHSIAKRARNVTKVVSVCNQSALFDLSVGAFTSLPNPYLEEFKWGEKEPAVEMQIHGARGYQAMP